MSEVKMLNMAGETVGTIELNDAVFGIEPNQNAVHAVVKNILANKRQGTQSAKTRAEVRGGGKKPFRQKGTGRHRQGSSTDPSQVGGGVVFAPKPKVQENEIIVVDKLSFEAPKTKEMIKVLSNLNAEKKALIVMAEKDENVIKSAANIQGIRTALVGTMNVYEIINHTSFIVTEEAVKKIEEVYA